MKHTVNKMTSHFVRRIFARITTPKVSQVSSSPPSSSFGFVYDYLHVILAHVNYPITQHHHLEALTVWQKANPASYQIYPISAILCTQLGSGGEGKVFPAFMELVSALETCQKVLKIIHPFSRMTVIIANCAALQNNTFLSV